MTLTAIQEAPAFLEKLINNYSRSKHPSGHGEQVTGKRYHDEWWWDAKIARKAKQAPSIAEGMTEYLNYQKFWSANPQPKAMYAEEAEEYEIEQSFELFHEHQEAMSAYYEHLIKLGHVLECEFYDSIFPQHHLPYKSKTWESFSKDYEDMQDEISDYTLYLYQNGYINEGDFGIGDIPHALDPKKHTHELNVWLNFKKQAA